jgi:hypothetical protein
MARSGARDAGPGDQPLRPACVTVTFLAADERTGGHGPVTNRAGGTTVVADGHAVRYGAWRAREFGTARRTDPTSQRPSKRRRRTPRDGRAKRRTRAARAGGRDRPSRACWLTADNAHYVNSPGSRLLPGGLLVPKAPPLGTAEAVRLRRRRGPRPARRCSALSPWKQPTSRKKPNLPSSAGCSAVTSPTTNRAPASPLRLAASMARGTASTPTASHPRARSCWLPIGVRHGRCRVPSL